jgi:hypothetical protein
MAGGGHRYSASQKEYEAAMLEWDSKKLMECVNTAEAILSSRLQILKQGQEGHPESEAIEDALRIFDFFSALSYTIRADRKNAAVWDEYQPTSLPLATLPRLRHPKNGRGLERKSGS